MLHKNNYSGNMESGCYPQIMCYALRFMIEKNQSDSFPSDYKLNRIPFES